MYSYFYKSCLSSKIIIIKVYKRLSPRHHGEIRTRDILFTVKSASEKADSLRVWNKTHVLTSFLPTTLRTTRKLFNPFYHVHYPICTPVLPGVFLIRLTRAGVILIGSTACICLISHLFIRLYLNLSNPFYLFHYPISTICTLVLPGVFLIRSTISIILSVRSVHLFYQESF